MTQVPGVQESLVVGSGLRILDVCFKQMPIGIMANACHQHHSP